MCPAHNGYLAERDYGKEVMKRYRRSGSRAREPAPTYSGPVPECYVDDAALAVGVGDRSRRG
ncbi:MAG: hypothetical protein ACE5JI_00830 [Acidobacteriota bacterium]